MQHVIVVGGGVIGLASAWWLVEAGYQVTLVERLDEVGSAASLRNGGQLSYRYVAPLADAGVPQKALQWLFQQDGPLRLRLEADQRQWLWMARFLYHCRASVNRAMTLRLLELGELSRQKMAELESTLPLHEFSWREAGKLIVYRSQRGLDAAVRQPEPPTTPVAGRRRVLTAAECVALEPALETVGPQLAGGIFNAGEAVADCHAFCLGLQKRLTAHPRFVGVVHQQASGLRVEHGRIAGVETAAGLLKADSFVLAAGIQSRTLAASAGIALPLYPLKGYSLTAPIGLGQRAPEVSVTDFERKVLYARIGEDLRIAAMVDMVGEDDSINPRRIASLLRIARNTMPDAADYARATPWAGLRPATPSSAPILGATPYANLWLNVGHGPLGFTFACGSAAILTRLIKGEAPPMALDGLTLA